MYWNSPRNVPYSRVYSGVMPRRRPGGQAESLWTDGVRIAVIFARLVQNTLNDSSVLLCGKPLLHLKDTQPSTWWMELQ